MSITGDIYNIDQSLTGEGITDLELNSLVVDGTFQKVDASYFNNISSNIQTQLNTLSTLISNNANLNYAFTNTNNDFTGSLNKFVSIECSNNVKTINFNGYQASFLEGATSNLQQQINTLKSGTPSAQSATISVGTTTTLSPGSNVSVTNSGTNLDAVFNFGIPRGLQGIPGNPGITPTFAINSIVDNLVSGSTPYVTITQNPTNNYILKFGLVQGATPTFSINPIIDNLALGSTPYVTITQNPTNANNYILKFGLVQGANGTNGITPTFQIGNVSTSSSTSVSIEKTNDVYKLNFTLQKGEKGDTGSGADALSIAGLVLGGAGFAISIGTALALFAEQLGLTGVVAGTQAGSQTTLAIRVQALEEKTNQMEYLPGSLTNPLQPNLGARFIFYKPIAINSGLGTSVVLSGDTACSFANGITAEDDITTSKYLRSKYLSIGTTQNTYLSVITGTLNIGYQVAGVSTNRTTTNIIGDNINIGNSQTRQTTINIGTDNNAFANTINIGNAQSTTNLYGNINGYIKQETSGTNYKVNTPFTNWT